METMTTTVPPRVVHCTTIPPDRYHPLSSEEFTNLNEILQSIGHNLPDDKLPYIWDNYNGLRGVSEARPCSCQSAAALWIRAIAYLRDWVKARA